MAFFVPPKAAFVFPSSSVSTVHTCVAAMRKLTFVTGNQNKLRETRSIIEVAFGKPDDVPFTLVAEKIDLPEMQGTPEEIAYEKCLAAARHVKGPVVGALFLLRVSTLPACSVLTATRFVTLLFTQITEDTCLCFNALGGMPGPYIKHFLEPLGPSGLVKMLAGFDDQSGYAQCTFAYCSGVPGEKPKIFAGKKNGTIVAPRVGTGFGWDPIFQPDGFDETFAEMDKSVKGKISHRFLALEKLIAFLKEQTS